MENREPVAPGLLSGVGAPVIIERGREDRGATRGRSAEFLQRCADGEKPGSV